MSELTTHPSRGVAPLPAPGSACSDAGTDGVEIRTSLREIMALAPHWRALEQSCPEPFGYFQTYDWCLAWIRTYALGPGAIAEPRIYCVWRDGRLVFLWPGMVSRLPFGLKMLSTLGTPHTQYSTALYDPSAYASAAGSAFQAALQRPGGADIAVFDLVPQGSLLSGLVGGGETGRPSGNETACLNLGAFASWEAYLQSLGARQRKYRKRRRAQLECLGEVGLRMVWPQDPGYTQLLETCVAWKRRWLVETGRLSLGLSKPGFSDFLSRLHGDRTAREGACLFVLEAGGRPVAIEMGFLSGGHFYAYLAAFDWQHRDLSPGKIATEMVLCWLMQAGYTTYDLLGNPAQYKSSWSNETVALGKSTEPLSLKGALLARPWLTCGAPALKAIYRCVPEKIRRSALTAMGSSSGGLAVIVENPAILIMV